MCDKPLNCFQQLLPEWYFFYLTVFGDCHMFIVRWRWALWRMPFTWWRIKPRSCGLWSASTNTGSTTATSTRSACASTASSTPLWMEASLDIRRYYCGAQWGGAACNNDCQTDVVWQTFIFSFHPLRQAFFDKDYISSHPEDTERITHLKDLMQEQVWPGLNSSADMDLPGEHGVINKDAFLMLLTPPPTTGTHPWSGAGRSRETGAPRDAPSAQKAYRSVPHDEDGFAPCE